MSKEKLMNILASVGLLLIAAGVIIPFFGGIENPVYRWIYSGGALLLLVSRLFGQYRGPNMRLKRLVRIELWAAIFFCVAAFFLFFPPGNNLRDVLAFTLAGGAIQIYTSIMIPRQGK